MEKIKEYIMPTLFSLLLVVNLFGLFVPQGMSEDEHLLKLKMHDLEQEKVLLLKQNQQYEYKIKSFENEILKNDSVIDNATTDQLDSLFSDYFGKR